MAEDGGNVAGATAPKRSHKGSGKRPVQPRKKLPPPLTAAQDRAAASEARGELDDAVAKAAGVSRSALYRLRRRADYRQRCDEHRGRLEAQAAHARQPSTLEAQVRQAALYVKLIALQRERARLEADPAAAADIDLLKVAQGASPTAAPTVGPGDGAVTDATAARLSALVERFKSDGTTAPVEPVARFPWSPLGDPVQPIEPPRPPLRGQVVDGVPADAVDVSASAPLALPATTSPPRIDWGPGVTRRWRPGLR